MKRRSTYLGFGLVAVSALVAVAFFLAGQTQTTSAAGGGPEMRLTANGCAADCTFALGEEFTLAVEIVEAPAGGYVLAQSFIDFGTDLTYDASLVPTADEITWDDCEGVTAVRAQTVGPHVVNHGCLTGLIGPLPSNYVGTLVEISLTCSPGNSTTEVLLLPEGDPVAITSGAAFATPEVVSAKVSNVSVTCGEGPAADTPTPTNTTAPPPTNTPCPGVCPTAPPPPTNTPTPTATPVPEFVCGDVNRDGAVTVLDALWVLWFDAGLIDFILPIKDNDRDGVEDMIADVSGDGVVNSIDAALILQIEAGLYSCV